MGIFNFIRAKGKKTEMKGFYSQFISKNDLCFDVGANIGERTDVFLSLGAKVVSVEPQKECLDVLRSKFGSNNNVTILPIVLGAKQTEVEFLLCDETNECSTLSPEFVSVYSQISKFHWRQKQWVQMNTLENLCEKFGVPKLCKIDVEGYESEVFKGMRTPITIICFEFNRPLLSDAKKSLEILSELASYECNYIEYERMNLVLANWMPIKEFNNKLEELIKEEVLTGEIIARMKTN